MANAKTHEITASKLRSQLAKKDDIIVCPGVYDGFTARLALNAGFETLYMVIYTSLSLPVDSGDDGVDGMNRLEQEPRCPDSESQI